MSSLSMVEAKLPPGFRFHPRDDELICDYLMKRFSSSETDSSLLIEVDLNKCEPWDIPEIACIGGKEWYFYSQRDRKYATGLRTNRATASGYWKATGKDRAIARKESLVGMRKTLVFYQGRAPHGKKTEWVMHEYRLEGPFGPPKLLSSKEDWVLCRVFHKTTEVAAKPPTSTTPNPNPNTTTCCDVQTTSSSSGLPPLMDSYITFDQTPQDDHDNNNNNNSNSNDNAYQQVPCFSIFNQNQVNQPNPPPSFSHLFNTMEPTTTNPTTMLPYHNTPGFQDTILTSATTNAATPATNDNNAMSSLSTSDKSMIKAVLSHLTKMGGSHAMKGSSPTSLGEAGSSESYLSDVGLPTMWTTHY